VHRLLLLWQGGDEGVRPPVFLGNGQLEFLLEAPFLERGLLAGEPGAEVCAPPGLFAGGVQQDMTIRRAHYSQECALGLRFLAWHY